MLREIENLVAEAVEVNIPFMNPITFVMFLFIDTMSLMYKFTADTVHLPTRLVFMPRPSSTILAPTRSSSLRTSVSLVTYQSGKLHLRLFILVYRLILFTSHRLTGWNAVKSRVEQLGLQLTDDEVRLFWPPLHHFFINIFNRSRTLLPRSRSSPMCAPNQWTTSTRSSVCTTLVSSLASSLLDRRLPSIACSSSTTMRPTDASRARRGSAKTKRSSVTCTA